MPENEFKRWNNLWVGVRFNIAMKILQDSWCGFVGGEQIRFIKQK
jgi:hypothetical protein